MQSQSQKYDNFFSALENTSPYFKIAAQGQAGTGKTFTLANIAIGLHKRIESKKPIVIFDTEKSAKFLRPIFKQANIEVLVKESRTLTDLAKTMDFCNEGNADILFIDSITHVYEDFLSDYQKKKNRDYIQFQDWAIIKPTWKREYSARLVNGNYHILFTGREGFTYEYEKNEDGKKELIKTGVKMKAEGETAYEPDMLLYMNRFEEVLGDDKKAWREATVIKDRSNILDGKTFKNPSYKEFAPVIEFLLSNISAKKETVSHTNDELIKNEEDNHQERQDRKIQLERNEALLDRVSAGTSTEAKTLRIALKEIAYHGEMSDLGIAAMNLEQLQAANITLTEYVDLISKIQRGEAKVYNGVLKAITAARNKYLDGEQCLGYANKEKLQKYLEHMIEKAKGETDEHNDTN